MSKLCAAAALTCALAAPAGAAAGPPSLERAEAAAHRAVTPLPVESALCIPRSRGRVLCLLRHPDAGSKQCRSAVLVRGRRVRVVLSIHCIEIEVPGS